MTPEMLVFKKNRRGQHPVFGFPGVWSIMTSEMLVFKLNIRGQFLPRFFHDQIHHV